MSANYGAVPLDTLIVVIYCLVAAAGVCIVRRFGPFSLSSYCVEDEYDSEGSKENISYRILAPSLFLHSRCSVGQWANWCAARGVRHAGVICPHSYVLGNTEHD